MTFKPIVYDLFTGLHGWLEAFLVEDYRCIGFDIVDMCKELGVKRPDGIELVLQDVLTLHGSQFKNAAIIVASPPCQAYSYRAMPWKRAKALPPPSNELFDACFRIQREACEAAGHHIPLIVENVRGAQPWVGRAAWNFGSYYLWGDIPALMPTTFKVKRPGRNFHFPEKYGIPSPSFHGADHEPSVAAAMHIKSAQERINARGIKGGGDWFGSGDDCSLQRIFSGTKQSGISGTRNNGKGDRWFQDGAAKHGSQSQSRKAASAQIAKIPFPLAQHIARVFKPEGNRDLTPNNS